MAEIVNLRAVKKERTRADARAQADVNAAKYGRSKAEKAREKAQAEKARATLDAHKRE
jgi:hypothetical protein